MEEVIDWMESITYKETRNYVQRILENLIVYEYRLGINWLYLFIISKINIIIYYQMIKIIKNNWFINILIYY